MHVNGRGMNIFVGSAPMQCGLTINERDTEIGEQEYQQACRELEKKGVVGGGVVLVLLLWWWCGGIP
jgi:hypothetical protein